MSTIRHKSVVSLTVSTTIMVTWGCTLAVSAAMGTYVVNKIQHQYDVKNPIITKADYPINPFTKLATHGGYTVELVQGDTYSVSVTGRSNKIAQVDVKQKDDQLNISAVDEDAAGPNVWCPWCDPSRPTITITLPSITQIATYDSGFIESSHFSFDQLDIQMHDRSMIFFDDTVGKQLKTELHDQVHLSVIGAADDAELLANGESSFTGINFKVKNLQVDMSEQSSAVVNVADTISGTMRSTNEFMYFGSPTITVEKGKSSTIISEVEADQILQQGGYVIRDENGQILEQGYIDENDQIVRQ